MANKNIIKTIGNREMDRKDFLKYSGLLLLSLVGFNAIVTLLTQDDKIKTAIQHNDTPSGFGNGKYGA